MKVLLLNGSSHKNGCTFTALSEAAKTLNQEGIETEVFQLGNPEIRDCCGCQACRKLGKCVFEDGLVNEFIEKAREADGFIFGTPVYYAHPTAAVASARRSGTTASFDVLNKYFTINNMPVVSSGYWNNIHGHVADEALQDLEGLQVMRSLGRNMAWLLKCIENGKQNGINRPQKEEKIYTNFIK